MPATQSQSTRVKPRNSQRSHVQQPGIARLECGWAKICGRVGVRGPGRLSVLHGDPRDDERARRMAGRYEALRYHRRRNRRNLKKSPGNNGEIVYPGRRNLGCEVAPNRRTARRRD
jgi:hypothetical protein